MFKTILYQYMGIKSKIDLRPQNRLTSPVKHCYNEYKAVRSGMVEAALIKKRRQDNGKYVLF